MVVRLENVTSVRKRNLLIYLGLGIEELLEELSVGLVKTDLKDKAFT